MTKSKKERKTQRKRDKQRRAVANEKRRQIRSTFDSDQVVGVDDAHTGLLGRSVTGDSAGDRPEPEREGNPEIHQWWDRYMSAKGNGRAEMVTERLKEPLDEEWKEALFPEAVFEAEPQAECHRYLELLDLLAREHRALYRTGLLWFLRSRVQNLLSFEREDEIANVVSTDAAEMTETGDAVFGTVTMLRLANLESEADELAAAAYRVIDTESLMPRAVDEVFHWVSFKQIRQCIEQAASDDAIAAMEAELKQLDANMDADVVELRRNLVLAATGKNDRSWERNELVGSNKKAMHKRYVLGYEFTGWLRKTITCTWSAADELRGLIADSIQRESVSMRDYLDGVPRSMLDQHLATYFHFMSLERFKAPATLIAVDHFVRFLAERDLVTKKSLQKTQASVSALETQLRQALSDEWQSFQFLDRLRSESPKRHA